MAPPPTRRLPADPPPVGRLPAAHGAPTCRPCARS